MPEILSYASKSDEEVEPRWRVILAIILAVIGCAVGMLLCGEALPVLWPPNGQIDSRRFVLVLFLCVVGSSLNLILFVSPASQLTKQRSIIVLAYVAKIVTLLPVLDFILFFLVRLFR